MKQKEVTLKKGNWYIVILACVISWGLLWGSQQSTAAAPGQQIDVLTPNICPEGQYLDLATSYCRNLHKNFGFDVDAFAENFSEQTVHVESCSMDALKEALDSIRPNGGIVQLPACTLELNASLTLPSRLILQGAGQGETVLRATSGLAGENMLRIHEGSQVIVRDLTLDGARNAERGLLVWYADNVLVERIEAMNMAGSGIVFRYTSRITIRYIDSHDHQKNHGIGSKDCFGETLADCEGEAGEISVGTFWSQDYAIYSNKLHNNGKYGLDSHASYGEVAGNLMLNNGYGSKFPNASYLWIHHNRIANNDSWGTHLYSTLQIPERYPKNIVFYQNEFVGNGEHPLIASAPVTDVYLIRNTFRDNASELLRTSDVVVYACDDGSGTVPRADGTELQFAEDAQCELTDVARLFGESQLGRSDTDAVVQLAEEPVDNAPTVLPTPTQDAQPATMDSPTPEPRPETDYPESITVPGRIEAEWYRSGGQGVGYSDSTLNNSGETYRDDGVDVQKTSDDRGNFNVGWIEKGEWLAYSIDVENTGEYLLTARLRTWESTPRALHVELDGVAITESVEFVDEGEPWMDVTMGSVQLTKGEHELRVVMDSDKFNFNYLDVELIRLLPEATPGKFWWSPQFWFQE